MRKMLGAFAVVVAGCGSDSPTAPLAPTPPPATRAALALEVAPNPVLAATTGDPNLPYSMRCTLNITETAGLSGNVNRISHSFVGSPNDATIEYNPAQIVAAIGSNHIRARSSIALSIAATYRTSTGTRAATFRITVEMIDERNNTVTATQTFNVV